MTASFKPTSAPGDTCQPSTPRHPHPHPQLRLQFDARPPRIEDARKLGFDAHPLIAQMWATVQSSCEAGFYRESDWARLRLEFWFASHKMASGQAIGLGLGGDPARAERDAAVPGDQTPRAWRGRRRSGAVGLGHVAATPLRRGLGRNTASRITGHIRAPRWCSPDAHSLCLGPLSRTEPVAVYRLGGRQPPVGGWPQERVILSCLDFRSTSALLIV